MTIRSLSFSFVNVYTTPAAPATVGRAPAAVSKAADCTHATDEDHSAVRPNRLTQALSAALREIGIGGAAGTAAPAASTDTAATAAAAPSTAGDLNAAVEQFAHALMDALGAGRGARGRSGEHRQDGEHGHHGHGRRNTRYGDFAQRLESLSQTIVQTPSAAPPAPAIAVAPVSLPPTAESALSVAAPTLAAPAPTPTRSAISPLLDAFSRLFEALKPAAAADAPATDMASRLQQFLHTMAQTLSHTGLDGAAAPQSGAFVDLRA